MQPLILALVTDTHVRVERDDGQRAFPSDATHNERNRRMAEALVAMRPALVIHLGDVVHPIPTLPTHTEALAVAARIYGDLSCPLVVAPGNHDVGDKHSTANAPAQVSRGRRAFAEAWGPPFRSLDRGGCHLVILDGTLLDADTEEADAQRAWLEADLAAGHERIFVFTHYPPFLCEPDEPEHYDNLGPRPRAWLLELLVKHQVEALFSGHVHRFFYNRYRGVDLYTLPSAAFVRPEYAALRSVPPADPEHGRDDREHLGVTRLTIDASGHRLQIVRPLSAAPQPPRARRLGAWLRHRLGRRAEIPYGDLDALARKIARDDAVLLQVLDLGLSRIRIPLADLHDPDVLDRIAWLARHGVSLSVFSAGPPTPAQRELHTARAPDAAWEVVCRPRDLEPLGEVLARWEGPALTLGRIGRPLHDEASGYFSHFPREGFHPDDPALDPLLSRAAAGAVERIAFRIAASQPVAPQVSRAHERARGLGLLATAHVELPFGTEARRQRDDALVAQRCLEADRAAEAHPSVHLLLDLLSDKDRGYWCRNGLLDGADRPREAYRALKEAGIRANPNA